MKVTANFVTIKEREEVFKQSLLSIYDQVDTINVYMNKYKTLPAWLSEFKKVNNVWAAGDNLLGDSGKFFFQNKGITLTCDDDIKYPDDYVVKTVSGLVRHGGVVSWAGKIVPKVGVKSFYKNCIPIHCRKSWFKDMTVHIPGSGVMAWHSDTIKFDIKDFKRRNMADIWVGATCKREGVKVTTLAHKEDWIKVFQVKRSIWKEHHNNDDYQTRIVNGVWNES